MSPKISVCCIKFEVMNDELDNSAPSGSSCRDEAAAAEAAAAAATTSDSNSLIRGRREPRRYRVETYSKEASQDSKRLFPKELSYVRQGSSEKEVCENDIATTSEEEDVVSFSSGNPFVEVTRGILHLYKENILSTLEAGSERCDTICILAIPASMTCHDLLNFTAAYHQDIRHLRIIKDGTPNQYMALVTFRSQEMACAFYKSFNGEPFSSLEPDCVCHLVFVSGVEIEESQPEPPAGHTELPTCPVCLERMDESVDGVLTILCNHTFHSNCLARWGDTSCPVCRYVSTPELVVDNRCLQCLSVENLWICLICGHVGCGRYVEGHAYKHYLATNHCYSMLLGTNRVWDYAGDNFVHRLLQNKGDGKLVEAEQSSKEPGMDEKMDSMQLEWTYQLTSQLEKQREFYEDKINRLQLTMANETAETRQKLANALEENKELKALLKQARREKNNLEKRSKTAAFKMASTRSQIDEEREISRALLQNQTEWQTKYNYLEKQFKEYKESKEEELFELKDQLRDIMFSLNVQQQLEASDVKDEIAEGTIFVGDPSPKAETAHSSKSRRRKRR
ncbi:UNVERIFIED_CONTAM: hypothetical protein PYX00_002721 [Menopon gallinae]